MAMQPLAPDAVEAPDPDAHAPGGDPFEAAARLRREDLVHGTEHEDTDPFWAGAKPAGIQPVPRQPRRLPGGPRLAASRAFEDASRFRVDRKPSPQLAFGAAEHVRLRANLARSEIGVLRQQLHEPLGPVEPAGRPERPPSSSVGGIERVPARDRRTPSRAA